MFLLLLIVIKSLPFLIRGLGDFCLFVFPVWGFVCFCWKKKKKTLAFSVCTAAGQEIKILKFLKIKEEEKK